MSEQQTQAASSPAEVDVFQGQMPTHAEFSQFRLTGEVPERFKPAELQAEAATDDAPEQTVDSEGDEPQTDSDSEPEEEAQEPPKPVPPAQKRILQLLAEKKDLERKLAEAAHKDVKPESSPAPAPQANAKPTVDDKNPDGSPKYADWDSYNEALIDWKAEQKLSQFKREQADAEAQKALKAQLEEARTRYPDADTVIFPTAKAIQDAQIPQGIKQIFEQSKDFIDLCYVIGSDPAELEKFVSLAQSDPREALATVFAYERAIREERAKAGKNADAPVNGKAPEKRQSQAPKPPSPVSGATSRSFDVNDADTTTADDWAKKRNAQLARKS